MITGILLYLFVFGSIRQCGVHCLLKYSINLSLLDRYFHYISFVTTTCFETNLPVINNFQIGRDFESKLSPDVGSSVNCINPWMVRVIKEKIDHRRLLTMI